jgi:5-(hydroxymethyl)furfural/furfural oxidase
MMAGLLRSERFRDVVLDSFASGFSPRVKKVGALTTANRLLTLAAGTAMDISAPLRRQIIRRVAMDGPPVEALLADAALLKDYLRATVTGIWHPCGATRMGRASDKAAVVDPQGRVIGVDNLSVADASVMPEIPTTNLNIPTIMIAERIADAIRQEERRAA